MKNTKQVLPILVILLGVSLSCTFLKDKFSKVGPMVSDSTNTARDLPKFDRNAPLYSPGASAVRQLAKLDSSLALFQGDVEAAERAAMKKAIADLPAAKGDDKKDERSARRYPGRWPPRSSLAVTGISASLLMFQAGDVSLPSGGDGELIGMLVGGMKEIFSESLGNGNGNVRKTSTETKGDTTTTMSAELGSGDDGSTVFGMGIKTESTKNGVKVVTDLQAKVDGHECPNAEGQLPLTVTIRIGAQSGGTGYTQEVTAFVRVVVDDNANIATTTIDITQGTRSSSGGREVYVETGTTGKYNGSEVNNVTYSNTRRIQKTDNATPKDVDYLGNAGHSAAMGAARGAIAAAIGKYYYGGCTKIEATSPGTVAPSSTTSIPVKVRHKYDGSEVPSKLEAVLNGETSIDPTLIPQTAGTLNYVAPGETGKSATIKLTATSRRGIATLDLAASTSGRAYSISGNIDDAVQKGVVCDTSVPFAIGGTLKFNFTPSSPTSGSYTYTGPYKATGSGPYTISENGKMVLSGTGCIMGHCATYSHDWTATPIDPATCGK